MCVCRERENWPYTKRQASVCHASNTFYTGFLSAIWIWRGIRFLFLASSSISFCERWRCLWIAHNETTTQRDMKKGWWRWRRQTATTRKHWRRTSYAWTAHQHVFQWHLKAVNILKVFLINNLYMYLRSASVFFFVAAVFIANGCSCFRFDIHSHPHKDTTIRGIREHQKVMANVGYTFFLLRLRFGLIYYLFVGSSTHTWCDGGGRHKNPNTKN